MSALNFKLSIVGLTTGTAQFTALQLKAPANHRVRILEIGVGFHDTVNTDVPATVEAYFQSTAGTMSTVSAGLSTVSGSETSLAALDQDLTETIQTTATAIATGAEPTYVSVAGGPWAIHPQTGIVYPVPRDRIVLKGGGYFGITIYTPASTTVDVYVIAEE